MSGAVALAIAFLLGICVGRETNRPSTKTPDKTLYHRFGECIAESVGVVMSKRKFVGPGVVASAEHTLNMQDGRKVLIIIKEDA